MERGGRALFMTCFFGCRSRRASPEGRLGLSFSSDSRPRDAGLGLDARDIEAAGSTEYESAFHKLLKFGDGAVMRMSREEMAAVQATTRAEEMRTALTVGSGAGGGFAIPIAIDPTVNLSSSGAINPIRGLAEVRTMSTRELRLVTSDGVVAQYQPEAAEPSTTLPSWHSRRWSRSALRRSCRSASRLIRTGRRWRLSSPG
jgi:HK97 family phage major capsid protein